MGVDYNFAIIPEVGGGFPKSDEEEQEIMGGRQEEKRKS